MTERIDQAWLSSASLQGLLKLLSEDGGQARIAGGAVRNALLDQPINHFTRNTSTACFGGDVQIFKITDIAFAPRAWMNNVGGKPQQGSVLLFSDQTIKRAGIIEKPVPGFFRDIARKGLVVKRQIGVPHGQPGLFVDTFDGSKERNGGVHCI